MKKSDKDDKGRMCNGVRRNRAIEKLKGEGQSVCVGGGGDPVWWNRERT